MKLCFATNNSHKIQEVKALLGNHFDVVSLQEIGFEGDLSEDYSTLEENSLQKAQYIYNNFAVNCFADDSGLEVSALNHEPGAKSARYAGDQRNDSDNIELLLKNLRGHENRDARFRTVISLIIQGKVFQFEGIVEGIIITEKKGNSGFGYDPVFIPSGFKRTFAEMEMSEKNLLSHRGKAVKKLIQFLQDYRINT